MKEESEKYRLYQKIGLGAGLAVAAFLFLVPWDVTPRARAGAAITALMICWWMTEALPIHVTAMVPLVAVPITACLDPARIKKVPPILGGIKEMLGIEGDGPMFQIAHAVNPFLDAYLFLFLGGMCIAAAMQKWNLHRRIALHIIRMIGGGPKRIILGFILATGFISMWISNTATAVMMVPIGLAVIRQLEQSGDRNVRLRHFGLAVMLAIAYSANVGGIGTMIGTAPNVVFAGAAEKAGVSLGFLDYIPIGLPFVVLFLPVIWLVLSRIAVRDRIEADQGREAIREEIRKLGRMSREEKYVLFVFALTAVLWICGQPIARLLLATKSSKVVDASTALVAALLLLAVPVRRGVFALDWAGFRKIPWSVLILLGGSFAMADIVGGSGLSVVLTERLSGIENWPSFLAFLGVGFLSVFVSAVASNTATTVMMMQLIHNIFKSAAVPFMGASAVAASCDFMLPAGTPPNAIVFGSGYVSVPRMMKTGFLLDILASLLAGLWGYFGLRLILGA